MLRINAFLASAGLGSRRAVERFVLEGRVQVNGTIIRELSHRVDPSRDQVTCDGKVSCRLEFACSATEIG